MGRYRLLCLYCGPVHNREQYACEVRVTMSVGIVPTIEQYSHFAQWLGSHRKNQYSS